jgi:hypothetical protein
MSVNVAEAYRPSLYRVDARVIGFRDRAQDRVSIEIKLPPEAVRLHGEPSEWTGIVMMDGQPIPGTGFRVRHKIGSDLVIAVLLVRDIRGPDVRIFAESGLFPTDLSPDQAPIDGHLRKAIEAGDDQTELHIGVGVNADPEDVTTAWTGMFTENGHDVPDSAFELTKVTKDEIRGLLANANYPSRTVRLYPPKAAAGGKSTTTPTQRHNLEPIDREVIADTGTDTKRQITIALGVGVDADSVTTEWVAAFVDAGQVSKRTFKLQGVSSHLVRAEVNAIYLPSYTVRLFPPGYKR